MVTSKFAASAAAAQVAVYAAPIEGYSCPDCGANHPVNGAKAWRCATCISIHTDCVAAGRDIEDEINEVQDASPDIRAALTEELSRQAAGAYVQCALDMIKVRRRWAARSAMMAEV